MAGLLARHDADHGTDLSEAAVFEVLLAREQLGTTGVGSGVAIPHGRLGGELKEIRAAVAVADEPIDFDAVDGRPVDILVGILAPAGRPSAHVRVLRDVSRLLRREAVRAELRAAASPGAAYALLLG